MNRPATTGNRYLVQLPVNADDLAAAIRVARAIARSLSIHNLIEYAQITVTTADRPEDQHPVFCPRQLPDGRRCLLRPDHDGPCTRRLPR